MLCGQNEREPGLDIGEKDFTRRVSREPALTMRRKEASCVAGVAEDDLDALPTPMKMTTRMTVILVLPWKKCSEAFGAAAYHLYKSVAAAQLIVDIRT